MLIQNTTQGIKKLPGSINATNPAFCRSTFYINCQNNTSTKFFCKGKGKSVKNDGNYRQVCVTGNCSESHKFCAFLVWKSYQNFY